LKLIGNDPLGSAQLVAPHAGAWIETRSPTGVPYDMALSPPTRGRGLKPEITPALPLFAQCRPPRGGVD